jgi:signal transduction histidine kinase
MPHLSATVRSDDPVVRALFCRAQGEAPEDHAILLTVSEINALTQRGLWARLGFSAFVGAIACAVVSWPALALWFAGVLLWEGVGRRPLERWAEPLHGDDRTEHALRKLALVHASGALIYAALPVLAYLSHTTLGAQIAMGWIAGAAIHAFVYFSNRRLLLIANLAAPVAAAVAAPMLAAGGLDWQAMLGGLVTLTLLAASAVFATDRNALLERLSAQISARRAEEHASALRAEILASMTHALRTPLNSVIGYAEMLEEDLAESGEAQQRIDAAEIAAASRRLLVLINDIPRLLRQGESDEPDRREVRPRVMAARA